MAPVGFWGPPTSTLDWCESNYEVTYYVAEFWNTISNVVMIIPPVLAAYRSWKVDTEMRVTLSYLALLCVGIGSWCFHMTLRYEMQLLDELPMIWGSIIFVYALFEAHAPPRGSLRHSLVALLCFYCFFVTVVYVTIKDPIIHQTAYAILVVTLLYKTIDVSRKCDEYSRKLVITATLTYAVGFTLWNIDNNFCFHVGLLRSRLPSALQPLTQLHFWWHIIVGYSTYVHIIFATYVRYSYLKKSFSVEWLYSFYPYLVCSTEERKKDPGITQNGMKQNGTYQNGIHQNGMHQNRICP
ncbi:PREDICTED: alkaline ceramidase 3-like [Priapulus caudatus]|uniref:Alkaline ceramidase n=1 Tax=Priapulus caudatus TaxID=37621 RepID=A0ABM1EAV9_PRICU|nr:PREDICTED: alkaline ceramidase 3-like [Priapulus caudatus]